MTLVEVAIGIAVLGVIGAVTAGMLRAGVVTYNYTMGQLVVLRRSRQALDSPGATHGLIHAVRNARGVSQLSPSDLTLEPAEGPLIRFRVDSNALLASQAGYEAKQADGVRSLEVKYFKLDESGRLVEAPSADGVALVVGTMKMSGTRSEFTSFSGAALRNR